MEVQWPLVAHGIVTALVVVSFLCGQWPIFRGTFVQKIHYFLTFGAYDYFLRFVVIVCGSRGRDAFLTIEHYCCDRPNPILQILYLTIIGGTYFLILNSSFQYVPGYYVSEVHIYASILAVGVGVFLFLLTSFSDPGTVTKENVSQYVAAYPYDDIIYTEKECSTCKILKPARSKHCGVCGRCVARFDHHCGWMNNCIGEKNARYFMAFLSWHLFLCLYGAFVLGLIIAGQIKERRVIYILTVYYGVDNSFSGLFPHIVQWLLGSYNTQILIIVFLLIISTLLIGFFGYHTYLCITNTTTNETFKWQDYVNWKRKINEAKASAAALKASLHAINGEQNVVKESKWKAFFRKSPLQYEEEVIKNNIYNRGIIRNIHEILIPLSERPLFHHPKCT